MSERTDPERRSIPCETCGGAMTFREGQQGPDRYSERFVCEDCGAEIFRSYGRGSV